MGSRRQKIHELWATMNGWVYDGFAQTYKQLGVSFDSYYYEVIRIYLGKILLMRVCLKVFFLKRGWVGLV
ncbi:MAG: hypothetical protein CM15mP59_4880 [Flavobacteriaceae bacterium]|nr:MAG: hypothetical protein CM15mP59_4880 [Flavobacteriaceae bacterium]